jgi:hypothetical protein
MTLYDFERNGKLAEGDTLLRFEDNTTRLTHRDPDQRPEPQDTGNGEHKDHWSPGGNIFFTGGYAWGTDPDGKRVCLGREATVKEAIANPKMKSKSPMIDAIINQERRSKIGDRGEGPATRSATNIQRRTFEKRNQRSRPTHRPEHRPAYTQRLASRPRISSGETDQPD